MAKYTHSAVRHNIANSVVCLLGREPAYKVVLYTTPHLTPRNHPITTPTHPTPQKNQAEGLVANESRSVVQNNMANTVVYVLGHEPAWKVVFDPTHHPT